MGIREARLSDVPAIAKVHVDTWRSTYKDHLPADYLANLSYQRRQQMWQSVLTEFRDTSFVYVADKVADDVAVDMADDAADGIVGFCACGPAREQTDNYAGEIYSIYVLDKHQGKGLGKGLLLAAARRLVEEGIPSMMLWVLEDNTTRGFYEAMGGVAFDEKTEEFGGASVIEVAYGWKNLSDILPPPQDTL